MSDLPKPNEPCTTADIYVETGGRVDTPAGGGDYSFRAGVNFSEIVQALADAVCTLLPCPGAGAPPQGETPPEDDKPPEGETPPEGEAPPEGEEPPEGEAPPENGDDSSAEGVQYTMCSDGPLSFFEAMARLEVKRKTYQNEQFLVEFNPEATFQIRNITFNKPFVLTGFIKRASGLSGNWFIPVGTYTVKNYRLRIPTKRRA